MNTGGHKRNSGRLRPDMPMGRALRAILRSHARSVFSYRRDIRSGPSIESVHRMRVAARRLRAVLRTFGKAFGGDDLRGQTAVFSGLIRSLGNVRDCDILIRDLRGLRGLVKDDPHQSLDELIKRQRAMREGHAAALRLAVRRLDAGGASAAFSAFVRAPFRSPSAVAGTLRENAGPVLERLLKETLSYRRDVVRHPAKSDLLHEMRIASRPLRYVMEAFEPAFGKAFSRCLGKLKEFLEAAGDVHDRDMMIAMLSGQIVRRAKLGRTVRIAKLLAAQRASRRKKFAALKRHFKDLSRAKYRKKILRSIT